jgi:HAMP domain-containing protein
MSEVFILSCVQQTSMTLPCVQLAALSASDALRQAAITPERLEMLVWGGRDLLESSVVPLIHLQRRGAAGLQAVWSAAQAVAAGDCDLVMAGGAGWLDSPLDNLEAVNAAATMVLASTVAVGKYNLPPIGSPGFPCRYPVGGCPRNILAGKLGTQSFAARRIGAY